MELESWEAKFEQKISTIATDEDPAHDLLHFKRVVNLAKQLSQEEKGDPRVVIPAAWLHDFVIIPKNSPLRSQASRLAAKEAIQFLKSLAYPEAYLEAIGHAIEAHSFSANIEPRSLEAKIVQDADRLDGLGAIGVARCFATAGLLKRPFYRAKDPFCEEREPNDALFTVDHFYTKLFKTAETLKTPAGMREGQRRLESMKAYLSSLRSEILRG